MGGVGGGGGGHAGGVRDRGRRGRRRWHDGQSRRRGHRTQALYEQHCANCHAVDGAGAIGPQLNDGRVVERFPEVDDQIAVITVGRVDLGMPPFGDTLTEEQIQAVAEYTRQL